VLQSAIRVLEQLGLDTSKVLADCAFLENEFLNTCGLLDEPE
jgi:hypothetical protein